MCTSVYDDPAAAAKARRTSFGTRPWLETEYPCSRAQARSSAGVGIAVSLPDHLVEQARAAVEGGSAASVSAYVAAAMNAYERRDSLAALLDDLDAAFGAPDAATRDWARQALGLEDG